MQQPSQSTTEVDSGGTTIHTPPPGESRTAAENLITLDTNLFITAEPFGCRARFAGGHEGVMLKQGHIVKNWKQRYFVLKDQELRYYADGTLRSLKGAFVLNEYCSIKELLEQYDNHQHALVLTAHRADSHGSKEDMETLYMSALTAEDKRLWLEAIVTAIHGGFNSVLIPDIWPEAFIPTLELQVQYTYESEGAVKTFQANDGNIAEPQMTVNEPVIGYAGNSRQSTSNNRRSSDVSSISSISSKSQQQHQFCTLLLVDVDHPARSDEHRRCRLHWLVMNVFMGQLEQSDVVFPYHPPAPVCFSELHRYFFVLFSQNDTFSAERVEKSRVFVNEHVDDFPFINWAKQQRFEEPIAVNGYYSKWTPLCDELHQRTSYIPPPEYLSARQSRQLSMEVSKTLFFSSSSETTILNSEDKTSVLRGLSIADDGLSPTVAAINGPGSEWSPIRSAAVNVAASDISEQRVPSPVPLRSHGVKVSKRSKAVIKARGSVAIASTSDQNTNDRQSESSVEVSEEGSDKNPVSQGSVGDAVGDGIAAVSYDEQSVNSLDIAYEAQLPTVDEMIATATQFQDVGVNASINSAIVERKSDDTGIPGGERMSDSISSTVSSSSHHTASKSGRVLKVSRSISPIPGRPPTGNRGTSGDTTHSSNTSMQNINSPDEISPSLNGSTESSSPDKLNSAGRQRQLSQQVKQLYRGFSTDSIQSDSSVHTFNSSTLNSPQLHSILRVKNAAGSMVPPLFTEGAQLGDSFYLGSEASVSPMASSRDRHNTSNNSRLSWDLPTVDQSSRGLASTSSSVSTSSPVKQKPHSILKRTKSDIKKNVSFSLPAGHNDNISSAELYDFGMGDFEMDDIPDYEVPVQNHTREQHVHRAIRVVRNLDSDSAAHVKGNDEKQTNINMTKSTAGEASGKDSLLTDSKDSSADDTKISAQSSDGGTFMKDTDDALMKLSRASSFETNSSGLTMDDLSSTVSDRPPSSLLNGSSVDGEDETRQSEVILPLNAGIAALNADSEEGAEAKNVSTASKEVTHSPTVDVATTIPPRQQPRSSATAAPETFMERVLKAHSTTELCIIFGIGSRSVFEGEVMKKKYSQDYRWKDRYIWIEPHTKSVHWAKNASEKHLTAKYKHFLIDKNSPFRIDTSQSGSTRSSRRWNLRHQMRGSAGAAGNERPISMESATSTGSGEHYLTAKSLNASTASAAAVTTAADGAAAESDSGSAAVDSDGSSLPLSSNSENNGIDDVHQPVGTQEGTIKRIELNGLTLKFITEEGETLQLKMPTGPNATKRVKDWHRVLLALIDES